MQNMYLNILQYKLCVGFCFFFNEIHFAAKTCFGNNACNVILYNKYHFKKLLKVYEKKCLSTKNIIVTNICTERQCRLRDH